MTEKTINHPSAWPWRLQETTVGGASLLDAFGGGVLDLWLPPGRRDGGLSEADRLNLQLIVCAPKVLDSLESTTQFLENMLGFYGHRLKSNAASRSWYQHAQSKIEHNRWLSGQVRLPWRPSPPFDGPEIPF
jgi:hypothetical protein